MAPKAMKAIKATKAMTGTLKRPAPASGLLKKPASSLSARGIAAQILQEASAEKAAEANEPTRDALKMRQWKKNEMDLPKAIQEEFGKASRAKKTAMVNNIVVRQANGSYSFDTTHPLYQDALRKFDMKFATEQVKGEIRPYVVARCGGEAYLGSFINLHENGHSTP